MPMTLPYRNGPVLPVVTIREINSAVPVAQALLSGGVDVIEITLRTGCALDAIRAIRSEVEGIEVGAGTIRMPADVRAAKGAGAQFLVSPGSTERVRKAAIEEGISLMPGVATVSEMMEVLDDGIYLAKYFPTVSAGSVSYLAAVADPLPDLFLCPTGGVGLHNARQFLQLPNVCMVGGSWLTPREAIDAGDWGRIRKLAKTAMDQLGNVFPP